MRDFQRCTLLLLLVLAYPDASSARTEEEAAVVDLGERSAGKTYPISLSARNLDCADPQDFRFVLDDIPWLRPLQEPVLRKLPPGRKGSIPALLDFTGMAPGDYQGVMETVCETCGFFIFQSCFIDQRALLKVTLVEAAAAESAPAEPEPGPAADGQTQTAAPAASEPAGLATVPAPLSLQDPVLHDVAASLAAVLAPGAVAGLAETDGGCARIQALLDEVKTRRIDCSGEEAAVAAARASLAAEKTRAEAERRRQAGLRAEARAKVSAYQAALGRLQAVQAAVNAAQARLNGAKQAVLNAVMAQTGSSGQGWSTTPPPGMNVVQPGQNSGRTPPYVQAVPVSDTLTLYFVDPGGLWNPINSGIAVSRLKQMLRFDIEQGRSLLGAIAAAESALAAARQALDAQQAEVNRLATEAQAADAAVHGLPPVGGAVSAAEQKLDGALAALEACRKRAAALAARAAELETALEKCRKHAAAAEAIDAAAKAVQASGSTVGGVESAAAGMNGVAAEDRSAAGDMTAAARAVQDEAERLIEEAGNRLAGGDTDGAARAAGQAGAASTRARNAAGEARDKIDAALQAARAEAAEEEALRNQVRRVTPHPVSIQDPRQLTLNLKSLLAKLHTDMLLEGRTDNCRDCRKAALYAAYHSSGAYFSVFARILTDVAFAPLDVLSGGGVRQLAVGLGKALVQSLVADASLSDGAATAIFQFLGGELFPKLVKDEFAAGKLNELAQGGLAELMQAEGVIASSWGDDDFELPCEDGGSKTVKVKGTMLANPATGWVVVVIQIDGCPPLMIKYRVTDGGVPVRNTVRMKLMR